MRTRSSYLLIALAVLAAAPVAAFSGDALAPGVGLNLHLGTGGLGAGVTVGITKWIALRGDFNGFSRSMSVDSDDVKYDGTFKLNNVGLLCDLFPTSHSFRFTLGVLSNSNRIDVDAHPTSSIEIGGTQYDPSEVGHLHGQIDFKKTAPYLGLGFGNSADKNRRVVFLFDLGVILQGSPKASLAASGGGVAASDLRREEAKIDDETKHYQYWPIVSFGIGIRLW